MQKPGYRCVAWKVRYIDLSTFRPHIDLMAHIARMHFRYAVERITTCRKVFVRPLTDDADMDGTLDLP